jgi:hypothetical protein
VDAKRSSSHPGAGWLRPTPNGWSDQAGLTSVLGWTSFSFSSLPALKLASRLAAMVMVSPVRGLRPWRSFFLLHDETTKAAQIYALVCLKRLCNSSENGLNYRFDRNLFPASLRRHHVNQL